MCKGTISQDYDYHSGVRTCCGDKKSMGVWKDGVDLPDFSFIITCIVILHPLFYSPFSLTGGAIRFRKITFLRVIPRAFYLAYILTFPLAFYLAYFVIFYLACNVFRHFTWHIFWQSVKHIFWYSIWHIFWHSMWQMYSVILSHIDSESPFDMYSARWAVQVRQCTLRSGACSRGPALPRTIGSLR